ncbi:MAG: nucleotidyltransferase family protein [Clostridia bacterium]|nr:nucleotidyltransferase family protein [Clostridia bacterium]
MDVFKKQFLKIIKSAFSEEKYNLRDDFDLKEAVKIADRHNIAPLFYYGIIHADISPDNECVQNLFMTTCKFMASCERQMYEINNVFTAFDNVGIEYMPLKGVVLKKLYPRPEMRAMGDCDVLIKIDQYDKIKNILKEFGFEEGRESNHELVWNKKGLYLELHKRLIPSNNKDYYNYFGDGWRLAKSDYGTRYRMKSEDELIFLFTHFAKHYREAGIGIKHLIDLWLFQKIHIDLDMQYIYTELEKLKLKEFFKNINSTIDVWFNGKEDNDITDFITENIFNSGAFGLSDARIYSSALKRSNKSHIVKIKIFIDLLFPSYDGMSEKYSFLKKYPYLMYIMWVVRWFDLLIFNRSRIKRTINHTKEEFGMMTDENIQNYQKSLNFVGLDFDFKD